MTSSYSIVNKHGGLLIAESESGAGTTFYIYIPASSEKPVEKDNKKKAPLTGSGKILVMDDEDIIRDTAQTLLGHIGYEVEVAKDGTEALVLYKKAKETKEPFDVVVLDLTVRGAMGGEETIKKLLEVDPEVKAIVSSGYSNNPVLSDFKQYGFKGVVAKPFKLKEMNDVLNNVMNQDLGFRN